MCLGPAAGFFFAPHQRPLETAAVDRNSEIFLNCLNALDSGHRRFCRFQTCYVVENIGGHLVPTLRSTLTGQQSRQASPIECILRQVEGGARDSKRGGGIENRHGLGAVPSQHLVADLEKIPGIEERVLFEKRIGDGFWMWIESAGALQLQHLPVGLSAFCHQGNARLVRNNNYASLAPLSRKISIDMSFYYAQYMAY
jgi:hypothetical protein